MHDLRLVGVHEDGLHLLLSDGDGGRFRVPLDEPLRAAVRRDRAHLGQLQIEIEGGLRPREVQALIRSGLSTQEVADRAGWTTDKVRRYEGPILAEREHVAGLARQVRLRDRQGSGRSSLGQRVDERLRGRGVDPGLSVWDSGRDEGGQWQVRVLFPAGGRERTASWWFDLEGRSVVPVDDEARWLSEDSEEVAGPIPHNPSFAAPSKVYDVEAEGGIDQVRPRAARPTTDLETAMRETSTRRRRGSRRNQPTLTAVDDAPREDALPLEHVDFDPVTSTPPPAVRGIHPLDAEPEVPAVFLVEPVHEVEANADAPTEDADARAPVEDASVEAEDPVVEAPVEDAPVGAEPEAVADEPELDAAQEPEPDAAHEPAADVEPEAAVDTEPGAAVEETGVASDAAPEEPEPPAGDDTKPTPAPAGGRRGRRSVPSWDDIMFGPGSAGS